MNATATLDVGRCKVTCSKNECYNGQRRGLAGRTMDGPVPKSPHSRRAIPQEEDVFGGRTKSGAMAASVEEHLNHAGMGRWQVRPVKKHVRGRPPVQCNPHCLLYSRGCVCGVATLPSIPRWPPTSAPPLVPSSYPVPATQPRRPDITRPSQRCAVRCCDDAALWIVMHHNSGPAKIG